MLLKREDIQGIFNEIYPSLCRFTRSIVGHDDQAREIAQESFLRLCKVEAGSIPFGEVRFWLFRVARNLAINELNKKQTQTKLLDRITSVLTRLEPSPEELLMRREDQITVRKLLDELSEHQRSALILREQEEMSYQDIALVLNITESKVKTDIFRGRKALRKLWLKRQKDH